MQTAERVSGRDMSDNFVFRRSILAYHKAAEIVSGDVLEIGTGMGYGIDVVAPAAGRFVTVDKTAPHLEAVLPVNAEFRRMTVPPLDFADGSFDFAVSFQVIEHMLRDDGRFIVSTPNAPMSLTRNPWHVREYTAEELRELLLRHFSEVECLGVAGNERVMEDYAANKASVERVARFDVFDLQHRLPRRLLRIPYDILNRINRRRLLADNRDLTQSITMDDYRIGPVTEESFDLYFIARKGR